MIISGLSLFARNLSAQFDFYTQVLGFSLLGKTEDCFSLQIGTSVLEFIKNEHFTPYHFAINIPSNQEHNALAWLKKRVAILPLNGEELVDFNSWNAKAMYFYDQDQNIVEFIARKNLNLNKDGAFSPKQMLRISEIGIPTDHLDAIYNQLNSIRPLEIYDGNFDLFCAAGDEEGLFIIIDKTRKGWFPNNDPAYSSEFTLHGDYHIQFSEGLIKPL